MRSLIEITNSGCIGFLIIRVTTHKEWLDCLLKNAYRGCLGSTIEIAYVSCLGLKLQGLEMLWLMLYTSALAYAIHFMLIEFRAIEFSLKKDEHKDLFCAI